MRATLTILMLVAVGLAGCSGGNPGADDSTFDDFEDLDATATTGIIRGVVVDETLSPIAGATVNVTGTPLSAVTDEAGRFGFSDLEPGIYFLVASAAAHEKVQQSVEVVAGVEDPPTARILLTFIPGLAPYFSPQTWSGLIGCAYRRWDPPSGGYGTTCNGASTIWPDHDNLEDYTLDMAPEHVQSSIVWTNTQMFGGEMSFNLRRTDTNQDTVDHDGRSPIVLDMYPEDIAYHEASDGDPMGGFDENNPLRVIVFTAHLQETEPPTGGWGFGLQIDQRFVTYTHIFYNFSPPEGWVFLDDGDPQIPA